MTFNEDSRVKIPAILHLCRLGYQYIPKTKQQRNKENNIFSTIFNESIQLINPQKNYLEIEKLLKE